MTGCVQVTEQDNYFLVQMDDGKANALGFAMLEQLDAALNDAERAGKPVVLAGRPGRFSAGFDLSVMGQGGDDMLKLLRMGADLSYRIASFPTPVVAAVSGHAIAMGALFCLSADYRVGIRGDFKLGLNEVAIGMTLPWFGIALARGRLAGEWLPRAVDLAMLFDPDTAVQVGYLDEVVDGEALLGRTGELAADFASLNMTAHRETKLRNREAMLDAMRTGLEREFA